MIAQELRDKIDFAIVTIKEEEFNALTERFRPWERVIGERHNYIFSRVKNGDGLEQSIVIVRCLEQGQGVAQRVTHDLIEEINPRWLLLVGIAGAVAADEYSLGDIMLASRLHDFSVSAASEGKPQEMNAMGGPVHPEVAKLLQFIPAEKERLGEWNSPKSIGQQKPLIDLPDELNNDAYYGDDAWRKKVRDSLRHHFPKNVQPRPPTYRVAPAASSNVLVKDTQLLSQFRETSRSITHVEMELGGVYQAAWRPHLPVLAIRALSDVVGYKRSAVWTEYACNVAAAFTHALLRTGVLEISPAEREALGLRNPNSPAPQVPGQAPKRAPQGAMNKEEWPTLSEGIKSGEGFLLDREIAKALDKGQLIRNGEVSGAKYACYEVSIGPDIKQLILDQTPGKETDLYHVKRIPDDGIFQIGPGETFLINAAEDLNIPADVFAITIPVGNMYRLGLNPESTFADPGFTGQFYVTVCNYSARIVKLKVGDPLARVFFFKLSGRPTKIHSGRPRETPPSVERVQLPDIKDLLERGESVIIDEVLKTVTSPHYEHAFVTQRIFSHHREATGEEMLVLRRNSAIAIIVSFLALLVVLSIAGVLLFSVVQSRSPSFAEGFLASLAAAVAWAALVFGVRAFRQALSESVRTVKGQTRSRDGK